MSESKKQYRARMRRDHGDDWWQKKAPAKKLGKGVPAASMVKKAPKVPSVAEQKRKHEAKYKKQGSWHKRGDDKLFWLGRAAGPDYERYNLIVPGKVTITSSTLANFGGNPNNLPIARTTPGGYDVIEVSKTYKDGFTTQDLEKFINWSMGRLGDHHHAFFEGLYKEKGRPLTYALAMGS